MDNINIKNEFMGREGFGGGSYEMNLHSILVVCL